MTRPIARRTLLAGGLAAAYSQVWESREARGQEKRKTALVVGAGIAGLAAVPVCIPK